MPSVLPSDLSVGLSVIKLISVTSCNILFSAWKVTLMGELFTSIGSPLSRLSIVAITFTVPALLFLIVVVKIPLSSEVLPSELPNTTDPLTSGVPTGSARNLIGIFFTTKPFSSLAEIVMITSSSNWGLSLLTVRVKLALGADGGVKIATTGSPTIPLAIGVILTTIASVKARPTISGIVVTVVRNSPKALVVPVVSSIITSLESSNNSIATPASGLPLLSRGVIIKSILS